MLGFGNLALVDPQDLGESQLRHLLRFAQLIEWHGRQALLEPLLDPLLPRDRHRLDQFTKVVCGH